VNYECNREHMRLPTNPIRMIGFSRALIHSIGLEPRNGRQHSIFADNFNALIDKESHLPKTVSKALIKLARRQDGSVSIPKSTWDNWWNGVTFPNSTYEEVLDYFFPKLLHKWMYRDSTFDRLQCNLSAIDLGWIEASGNPEKAFKEAKKI
jgi:hypothetical protein